MYDFIYDKHWLYDFHYNYIKAKYYNNNVKWLFTDTDSLVYEIKIDDVYKDFYKDKDLFDPSNYPKDSRFKDLSNMNEIGKMKDISDGKIIIDFVGLESNMYSLIDKDG